MGHWITDDAIQVGRIRPVLPAVISLGLRQLELAGGRGFFRLLGHVGPLIFEEGPQKTRRLTQASHPENNSPALSGFHEGQQPGQFVRAAYGYGQLEHLSFCASKLAVRLLEISGEAIEAVE